LARLAQGIERLNYDVLWDPASVGYESLSLGGFLLAETDLLCVASGRADTIRTRLKAHVDAGATHGCIQPLNPDGQRRAGLEGAGGASLRRAFVLLSSVRCRTE